MNVFKIRILNTAHLSTSCSLLNIRSIEVVQVHSYHNQLNQTIENVFLISYLYFELFHIDAENFGRLKRRTDNVYKTANTSNMILFCFPVVILLFD